MNPARWVAAVGVCALVAALALVLLHREPRRSGTNLTPAATFILGLTRGRQACQGSELLPADTAAVQLTVGTYGRPGPPLEANVYGPQGKLLTSGRLAGGWPGGVVRIPVRRVRAAATETKVCIRELPAGRGELPIALAGNHPLPGFNIQVAGTTLEAARLRFDYYRPGRESWYQLLPTIAYRFSLGKAGFLRHWEWVAVILLILGTAIAAVTTILRSAAATDTRT